LMSARVYKTSIVKTTAPVDTLSPVSIQTQSLAFLSYGFHLRNERNASDCF